jgi:hypothetical protein
LREAYKGALSRFSGRIGRRLLERERQLFVTEAHLETADDCLPFLGAQTTQPLLIRSHRLEPHGLFERRSSPFAIDIVGIDVVRQSCLPTNLVAHAIHDRLPQVRLKCAGMTRLKPVYSLKRLEERVLDNIIRVGQAPSPCGHPPSCKSLQRAQMTRKQPLDGGVVAFTRARK